MDTYVFTGYGSKNDMKSFANAKNHKVFTQINDNKGFRHFISFVNWKTAWEKYKAKSYKKRYMYELIVSDSHANLI